MLPGISGVVFDAEGTLLVHPASPGATRAVPGAIGALWTLRSFGIPYVVLTNCHAMPVSGQAARLRAAGLPVADAQLLTPGAVAADHMLRHGVQRALVLGAAGVQAPFVAAGLHTCGAADAAAMSPQAVYVGWCPDCRREDIAVVDRALSAGATLYVAPDMPHATACSGATWRYARSIVGALQPTARARKVLVGKPSGHALRFAARQLGIAVKEVAVVGDDPARDMRMARRGGATALGVTTGVTPAAEWAGVPLACRPHRVLKGLEEVLWYVAGVMGPCEGD